MKVLGLRTSPSSIRYAVLECDSTAVTFINANGENKINYPPGITDLYKKLQWLHQELDRVIRRHPSIEVILIKVNEFGRGGESGVSRESAYLDAIGLLVAAEHNLPAETKLYRSIGTKRAEVKSFAETRVGKSEKYWNDQMADAVAVALSGCKG